MREFEQEIESRQGQVAVISFASHAPVKRFAERLNHPFLWLADPQRFSYHRLGLGRRGVTAIAPPRVVWGYIRLIQGGRTWRPEQLDLAQMGGDFVFDRDGNLTLSHVSTSSGDRPSAQALMVAFRRAAER